MADLWSEISFTLPVSRVEAARGFLGATSLRGWEESDTGGSFFFRLWVEAKKAKALKSGIETFLRVKTSEKKIRGEKWGETWKRFFKPIPVGKRLIILPSWGKPPRGKNRVAIRIHPGVAFGTGDHPTTRMCLAALEKSARHGQSWLDFGTGSGILAIALAKLGAKKILAVDEDDMAVRSAKQNAERNRAAGISFRRMDRPPESGKFDGIVSNILAEPLVEFASDLIRLMKPGGSLILSGITREKGEMVARAYKSLGCRVEEDGSDKDWVCLRACNS